MSLVKQLLEEIEEINRKKPQWKRISEEYPLATELKYILVCNNKRLMMLKSSRTRDWGLGETYEIWTTYDAYLNFWGQNNGSGIMDLSQEFLWWKPVDLDDYPKDCDP